MAYDPSRPGIPTLYNGIQFRSRLEAKWAAFFDLLGWEYEYEPFDLDGWIPDFLIKGKPKDILVEVKPVTECPADVVDEIWNACPGEYDETGEWFTPDYDLLILGCSIPADGEDDGLGWEIDTAAGAVTVVFGTWEGSDRIGYFRGDASWDDRISGEGGDNNQLQVDMDHVVKLWREAGSRVQWKGKRQTNKKARRRPLPSHVAPVRPVTRKDWFAAWVAKEKATEADRVREREEERRMEEQGHIDGPVVTAGLDPLDMELIRVIVNKPSLTATAAAKIDFRDLRDAANRVVLKTAYDVLSEGVTPTYEAIAGKLVSPHLQLFVENLTKPIDPRTTQPKVLKASWESRLDGILAGHEERKRRERIRQLEVELRETANDPSGAPEDRRLLLEEYLRLTTNRPGTKAKSATA